MKLPENSILILVTGALFTVVGYTANMQLNRLDKVEVAAGTLKEIVISLKDEIKDLGKEVHALSDNIKGKK